MPDTRIIQRIERSPELLKVIAAAGNLRKLALLLDVNPTAVRSWTRVPLHRILEIEKKLDVPREIMYPELFVGFKRIGKSRISNS